MPKLWFLQSVLSAVAAITCIPTFFIFNSSTCVNTSTNLSTTTCQFGTGSYLTIISCICLICITVVTQCIHHPSIPINIRDIQIPNISNRTRGTNIPLQVQEKESRLPPSSDFYKSLNFFRLKSSNEEEKVEEGMEVPYVNGIQSSAARFDPYNSDIVVSDDTDGSSNMNNTNFCNPVAGIVSAVFAVGSIEATSTSSDDTQDDEDIISVEESENDKSSTSDNHSESIDVKATPSSLLYSTSIMDDDGDADYDVYDNEDPIIVFHNNTDNDNMMHRGRSTNDATVKYSNTAARNDDTNVDSVIIQRDTDAIELPNVSLLDADTTTVHDETSASNFDLGSLEPSTILFKGSFMTENEEYDVNGDESILDAEISSQPHAPPSSTRHQNEIVRETSAKPQTNTHISNVTLSNVTQMHGPAEEADSVQIVESKKIKRFELPKPNRLFNMCLKPLHLQQYHGKHQQRGYRYLEDIEIGSLFQPIIVSPPLEILTVHSTNDMNKGKRIERNASSVRQQHQSENQNQLSALERQEQGKLYNEWNEMHSRTMQTYSDEPEPYLELSDEELSDDDNNNESEDVRRNIDGGDALYSSDHLQLDAVKKKRSKSGGNRSRRRRQYHSSNRSVASSTTNLSLLTATIAEETSEDLHDGSDDDSLLNSSIVPLVRSRSDPNLARYYSTKTTNNHIYDEIHMTGIHHYRSAQIFPQSNGSSSSPNFRRNVRWNSQHHDYRSLENDTRQGSASLLSIQRRRQHQLRYNNKNLHSSSARSVPNEKSYRLTNKSIVKRKTPMFRSERASLGIHYRTNDEPSTSSSSNTSGDSQNVTKHNGTELLPSQKARMARFHRIQQQKHMHSLNSSTSSHVAEGGISTDHIVQTERLVNDEKNTNHSPMQQHDKNDMNETTLSTTPDESIDIDDGTDRNHKNEVMDVGDGDQIINYGHHRHSENPANISFDSHSTSSSGMNNENDTSYMIDLLDVQLAELNRPDGALIGPDEASL